MRYALFGLLLAPVLVAAQLADPTRPAIPPAGGSMQEGGAGAAQAGLNTVVIAREGVFALKDGRVIRVGSHIDEGVVTRIAPDAVYVRGEQGKELRLPIWPDVKIDAVQAKRPAAGRSKKP